MAPIQVAQAQTSVVSADVAETARTVAETAPENLSLQEMLRIMDVATTLRKEQELVHQQLNLEETKAMLRERLLAASQVTGERLTAEQVDAAIENYYDKLHQFEQPKWSLGLLLANLYVLRAKILKWGIVFGAVASYFLLFS